MKIRLSTFLLVALWSLAVISELHAASGPGFAVSFDGNNDRVQAPTNSFGGVVNSFTIELWANPTGFRTPTAETNSGISDINQRFAVFPDHGDLSYGGNHVCTGLSVGLNGISVFEHAVNHLPSVLVYSNAISGWTHVALVYDNRQPRLYVNGILVRAGLTSAKAFVHPSANLGGSIHAPGYGPYAGQLDEVRIWNVARTQTQIQTSMNRSLTGGELNLLAYYRCDEGSGTTLGDGAPAGPIINGALTNGAAFVLSGVPSLTQSVETLTVSATGVATAALNAVANPGGTNTRGWFQWGETTNYANVTLPQTLGSGHGPTNFSAVLNSLIPDASYHFRAVASNSFGIVFGADQSFPGFSQSLRVVGAVGVCNFTQVTVFFNQFVDADTSGDPFNYTVIGGHTVYAAVRNADNLSVTLTTDPQTPSTEYTVTVANVTDLVGNTVAAPNNTASFLPCIQASVVRSGFALQELYFGIGGVKITDLTGNPGNAVYPNSPSRTRYVGSLSANNSDEFDNYGTRISGWIIPPISGLYVFYLASDDGGDFSLSTDDNPANLQLVAVEPVWASRRNYIGEANGGGRIGTPSPNGGPQANITAPITLVAGERYYFEARMKEAGGGDNLDVAWQIPGGPAPVDGDAAISGVFLASLFNPPEIIVEQSGTNIGDGGSSQQFLVAGSNTQSRSFTIRNIGGTELTGLTITINGPDASMFNVAANPLAPVAPGGNTTFTVRFAPTSTGAKTATLHLASNDEDENPFDIVLPGLSLSFAQDTDGDGLNDGAEFQMASLGFDFQVSQTSLVNTLFSNLSGTIPNLNAVGFFTQSQLQSLSVDTPLLAKNPVSGLFKLTIGVQKATQLTNFFPFPMTAPQTTINGQGKLEFQFSAPDNAGFFRLEAR